MNSSSNAPTQQQRFRRRLPYILTSLLSSVHRVAANAGRPQSLNGLVFFTATQNQPNEEVSHRPPNYHVNLKTAADLSPDQIERILAIVNENRTNKLEFEKPRRRIEQK